MINISYCQHVGRGIAYRSRNYIIDGQFINTTAGIVKL